MKLLIEQILVTKTFIHSFILVFETGPYVTRADIKLAKNNLILLPVALCDIVPKLI